MPIGTPVGIGIGQGSTVASTTVAMTTTGNIVSGDLVVVAVFNNTTLGPTATAVSDGTNSYTKATSLKTVNTDVSIWYAANATAVGSGGTITATFSGVGGSGSAASMAASRVTGILSVAALDKVASSAALASDTTTATTATLSEATEIAFGVSSVVSGSAGTGYTGAAGFTNTSTSGATGNGVVSLDYKQLSSQTAVVYTPIWGASGSNIMALVGTFRAQEFSSVSLPGTGLLSATGGVLLAANYTFGGSGSLSAMAGSLIATSAMFAGNSSLVTDLQRFIFVPRVPFAGSGRLSVDAVSFQLTTFSGQGGLDADPYLVTFNNSSWGGVGNMLIHASVFPGPGGVTTNLVVPGPGPTNNLVV